MAARVADLVVDRNVEVPMRDGVVLRADVYRPATGAPVPAVVNRTPYDRTSPLIQLAAIEPTRVVEAGLALVCQDVRGRFGSDGEFYTFFDDGRDSFDTVEWAAAQPWCDGSVGMVGRSYAGAVQWRGALERPPHLQAISPIVTGSDLHGWVYEGGALQFGFNVFWIWLMSRPREVRQLERIYRHLPLRTLPIDDLAWARLYAHWIAHSTNDNYWRALSINRRYEQIDVPAFVVGGWYDVFIRGTLENYVGLRARGGSEAARGGTRLLVGPWAHGSTYGPYPEHAFDLFGHDATIDVSALQLRFFGRHLLGNENGLDDEPPVRIFVMGENRWRDEDDWPLARARETRWHLRASGRLTREVPDDDPPDQYVYDPRDAAPTIGGPTSLPARMMRMNSGPLDQRRLEERDDVLVFTSDPVEERLEVTGTLTLVLHAATSAPDTDFVAKLVDVHPDGAAIILAEGALRVRFHEGFEREVLVEPDLPYEYRIDLGATSNVFLPGHCIRLLVTSSSFPRFDRNPNTGRPLGVDGEDDLRSARQTIFHDSTRPSHLLLPVVR